MGLKTSSYFGLGKKMIKLNAVNRLRNVFRSIVRIGGAFEHQAMLSGKLLADRSKNKGRINSFKDVEFSVFSQFGDDGIIQWLIGNIDFPNQTFIEFGVEDYLESNTRFLLMNDNWSGFVMDGSERNVSRIVGADYYWRYDVTATAAFIDATNIDSLLASSGFGPEVGILHIDLDGNDYWVWNAIKTVSPIVVIVEYNSVFGSERAITVPYDRLFQRTAAHYSNLYWGASLASLQILAEAKGYRFIGCNSAGNNAYFVRTDRLNDIVREIPVEQGFVESKYRESRDQEGRLNYLRGAERLDAIRGIPVHNVRSNQIESL